ncbi:unnamed protein product [Phyllotreta striolata]|uniref:E3 ubiquitin-protein ligase n=1 Tax=Phyllotreta striolata TaxID=444603 RepID=A0A9N9TEQ3_PHYSR|nr:unnamed protein product [Phyllotreta striolata]
MDLEQIVREELTCPACFNFMAPPIKMCTRGHSVCNDCLHRVTICPKCRGTMSACRNFALESIHSKIVVPCKYQAMGCEYECLGESMGKHQAFCNYTKTICPFANYDNCKWKDALVNLRLHLLEKHANNFYVRDKQKFVSQKFANIQAYHYIFAVMYYFEHFFRITWECSEVTGLTRWAVYLMGSPEDAKKYAYKLEFTRGHLVEPNAIPLSYKSVCDSMPQKSRDLFKDHSGFYIHKSELDKYCTNNGNLHYKITIYSLEGDEDSTKCDAAAVVAASPDNTQTDVVNNSK